MTTQSNDPSVVLRQMLNTVRGIDRGDYTVLYTETTPEGKIAEMTVKVADEEVTIVYQKNLGPSIN